MAKYLDATGLTQVWTAIKTNFVRTESGKGLSSNDYTTAEQEKLASIAASAQTNVIEEIKVNGTAVTITDKAVDIAIPAAAISGVKSGEKIIGLDGTELTSTLAISIEQSGETGSEKEHIVLKGINGEVISAVDASQFVVDGMLSSVTLSGDSLVFVFNTVAGKEEIDVDLSKYIDVYTAGSGITIDGNAISTKLAQTQGNVTLSFDANGGLKAETTATTDEALTEQEIAEILTF